MLKILLVVLLFVVGGCGDSDDGAVAPLQLARAACESAAESRQAACDRQCSRFADPQREQDCDADCATRLDGELGLCRAPLANIDLGCGEDDCRQAIEECRQQAEAQHHSCSTTCESGHIRCFSDCDRAHAASEEACGFQPVRIEPGVIVLEPGVGMVRSADLESHLDADELAVVEAADRRAAEHRARTIRLWTGAADTEVRVEQVEHAFRFGFPVDFRELQDDPDDLAFYGDITGKSATLMVAETSLKWRNTQPQPGELRFDLADDEIAWAESNGFDVKAHVLLWGNAPPAASGSGTPEWLRDRYPDPVLGPADAASLRQLIRERVDTVVPRYAGRIDVWEVTNEMLNPLTSWFATRLGPGIVNDIFTWTRAADPGAELVYNEWISEIFTGLPGPDSVDVRDRVLELLDAGVPIDAVGQQGHFAPGLVNVGVDVDLSQRTRVDDYAEALDTLAETGLPIHITEVTFAAPDEPEARAAQAEAIMRVWWGHPLVEEIILWNFWNPLGPRSHLDLGVYGDDRAPSRHGEAILSLINERWRTSARQTTDAEGVVELSATLGDYEASWQSADGPVVVRFHVGRGPGVLDVVAAEP